MKSLLVKKLFYLLSIWWGGTGPASVRVFSPAQFVTLTPMWAAQLS